MRERERSLQQVGIIPQTFLDSDKAEEFFYGPMFSLLRQCERFLNNPGVASTFKEMPTSGYGHEVVVEIQPNQSVFVHEEESVTGIAREFLWELRSYQGLAENPSQDGTREPLISPEYARILNTELSMLRQRIEDDAMRRYQKSIDDSRLFLFHGEQFQIISDAQRKLNKIQPIYRTDYRSQPDLGFSLRG